MAEQILELPIQSGEVLEGSVQSCNEPAPETHGKISREKEAELALNSTLFSPGACGLLIALFVLTLAIVPILQLATEIQIPRANGSLPMFNVFKVLPAWAKIGSVRSAAELWDLLPRADEIKSAEKAMENESVVSLWLRPRIQSILTGDLHAGTEQVYAGRDRWLFYRPDVDYVTGPPFLDSAQLKQRAREAGIQPDPINAIVDFRNQLAARGIELIVMPMPGKPCIDSEMMTASARQKTPLQNASFGAFKALMERQGVHLFDPVPLLIKRKAAAGGAPLYLETDTHWRPETMEFVAQQLAAFLGALSPLQEARLRVAEKQIAAYGDILTMLKLPAGQKIYNPQKITIKQVLVGNALWRPNKDARVLLLGDSFCNIFSLEPMGWGESAGFAEHLSRALGGQPLDCILRNSDGAFATREILSRELARGRDRLAGKKVVVWEFAVRELAFGNWKPLEMKTGQAQPAHFLSLKPGEESLVTGTIEAVSTVPLVGSEPYKDHIFTVHLVDIAGPEHPEPESLQALVCLWSMRDNVLTPAARLRPGDRITVRLRSWTDVSGQYEKINRSEIDDPAVQLEEPVWGDVMN
jgi:SGNH hydrolase-like domain, acetyltransferase AlgX